MAYEDTDVPVSRSQEQIRQIVYAHKGTGVMFMSQPLNRFFPCRIRQHLAHSAIRGCFSTIGVVYQIDAAGELIAVVD